MRGLQRVVWSEGMLVSPQHLQQADLYHERMLDCRLAATAPLSWGITAIEIDSGALAADQLVVDRFAGVLPDGLPLDFKAGDPEAPAARPIGANFPPQLPALEVYLALPKEREGVPSVAQKGPWEGSCTFTAPGTYRFEGDRIYSDGSITVTSTTSTSPGTSTSSTPATGGSGGSGDSPSPGGSPAGTPAPDARGSLLVGSPSSALRLSSHGESVHGSLELSTAAAGAGLEVRLLIAGAHGSHTAVGRIVRSSLPSGRTAFNVPLDARGRHELRSHGRLRVSVKVKLTPSAGAPLTLERTVVLRG